MALPSSAGRGCGTILDPFAGTGTTGEAAWREGMKAILIEREAEYHADIARRMRLAERPDERKAVAKAKASPSPLKRFHCSLARRDGKRSPTHGTVARHPPLQVRRPTRWTARQPSLCCTRSGPRRWGRPSRGSATTSPRMPWKGRSTRPTSGSLDWQLETDRAAQNARENMPADGTGHTGCRVSAGPTMPAEDLPGHDAVAAEVSRPQSRAAPQGCSRAYHEEENSATTTPATMSTAAQLHWRERVAAGNTTLEEAFGPRLKPSSPRLPLRSQDKFDRLTSAGPKNVRRQMIEKPSSVARWRSSTPGLKSGTY